MTEAEKKLVERTHALIDELRIFAIAQDETSLPALTKGFEPERRDVVLESVTRESLAQQTEYAARFSGRAIALLDAFRALSIAAPDPNAEFKFKHVGNSSGVREVMHDLQYMVEKLELRP